MLQYLIGPDFNARSELDDMFMQQAKAAAKCRSHLPQLCTIIDLFESLKQSRLVGFTGISHKWSSAGHEDLFLYSAIGVMGAMNVPGNGRAQTFDVGLVGSTRIQSGEPKEVKADEHEVTFSYAMNARRRCGEYRDWP